MNYAWEHIYTENIIIYSHAYTLKQYKALEIYEAHTVINVQITHNIYNTQSYI